MSDNMDDDSTAGTLAENTLAENIYRPLFEDLKMILESKEDLLYKNLENYFELTFPTLINKMNAFANIAISNEKSGDYSGAFENWQQVSTIIIALASKIELNSQTRPLIAAILKTLRTRASNNEMASTGLPITYTTYEDVQKAVRNLSSKISVSSTTSGEMFYTISEPTQATLELNRDFLDQVSRKIATEHNPAFIFHGPPGTGKTTLARELGNIYKMSVFFTTGGKLIGDVFGEGPKLVDKMFSDAQSRDFTIIIVDESEAIFNRSGTSDIGTAVSLIANSFLVNLDNLRRPENNKKVFLILITNFVERIDAAVFRRLESVYVGYMERKVFLDLLWSQIKNRVDSSISRSLLDSVNFNTEKYSPALVKKIISLMEENSINVNSTFSRLPDGRFLASQNGNMSLMEVTNILGRPPIFGEIVLPPLSLADFESIPFERLDTILQNLE